MIDKVQSLSTIFRSKPIRCEVVHRRGCRRRRHRRRHRYDERLHGQASLSSNGLDPVKRKERPKLTLVFLSLPPPRGVARARSLSGLF